MRTLAATALAFFALTTSAAGDGLPIGGPEIGPSGVELPGGSERIVALAGSGGTAVARVRTDGGRVEHWSQLSGPYTIPAVALDGSPGGLGRDGKTLVLIRPRPGFPQKVTKLAVISTKSLAIKRGIVLRGDFSFDALSPDGRTMYLVEYTSKRDPTRYLVRAYDLRTGRLLPDPIVDPAESPDEMRGYPVTRATSADGRWAFTLYDGNGRHPFVHALDTVEAEARCIDLYALHDRDILQLMALRLRFADAGRTLHVMDQGKPALAVDTSTFEVGPPRAATAAPAPVTREEDQGSLVLPGAILALFALGTGAWAARRRRAQT